MAAWQPGILKRKLTEQHITWQKHQFFFDEGSHRKVLSNDAFGYEYITALSIDFTVKDDIAESANLCECS